MDKEKATIVFFSVVIIFLIIGIISTSNAEYKRGYNEGNAAGYECGYEEGYTTALSDYGIN